jgi:hypothetical protein
MKTAATEILPEIEWDRGDLVEEHDHETHYVALGLNIDDNLQETFWIGTWVEIGAEVEIINIELE